MIFGDRVFQNMYYVPPSEYLAESDPERSLQRTLDRIEERADTDAALAAAERRFRLAIDHFPFTFVIYDPELRYAYVNERGIRDSGMTEQQMIGKTNEELWPAEIYGLYLRELHAARDTDHATRAEFTTVYSAGHQDIETLFVPISNTQGALEMILGISYDQTERNAINAELAMAKSHLEELVDARTADLTEALGRLELANKAKSRFLANMSHDLRTPLNSIIGFSGTLGMGIAGELNEEQRKQVSMIEESGRHLLHLVSDLLDIERIESGVIVLEPADLDLVEIVSHVVRGLGPLAQAKGLVIQADPVPPMRLPMRADAKRLREIVQNLAENAIKFTDSGRVDVRAGMDEDHAWISVSDTGRGIPAQEHKRIFEEFAQVKDDAVAKTEGTGLGLSIANRLTELMSGTLSVDSAPGEGATFVVRIPV